MNFLYKHVFFIEKIKFHFDFFASFDLGLLG